jgi:hypothetical protein
MDLSTHFSYGPMRKLAEYMATANFESQEIAVDGSNSENIQSTGTGDAMIAGTPVNIAQDAELDISADETTQDNCTNAVDTTIDDGDARYFVVLAKSDGTLSMWTAGEAAESGDEELKIPAFDPETYVCVGIVHIDNDSGSEFTVGTTGLDAATTSYFQVTGPVFPHADNLSDVI